MLWWYLGYKVLNDISMEFMEYVNEDAKKKKKTISVHWGRAVLIATGSNLLDTKYESYEFNDDLRDTIN